MNQKNFLIYLLSFLLFVSCMAKNPPEVRSQKPEESTENKSSTPQLDNAHVPQEKTESDLHRLIEGLSQSPCSTETETHTQEPINESFSPPILVPTPITSQSEPDAPSITTSDSSNLDQLIQESTDLPPLAQRHSSEEKNNIQVFEWTQSAMITQSIPHKGSTGGLKPNSTYQVFCHSLNNTDSKESFDLYIYQYKLAELGEHPLCEVLKKTKTSISILSYAHYQREHCDYFVNDFKKQNPNYRCE